MEGQRNTEELNQFKNALNTLCLKHLNMSLNYTANSDIGHLFTEDSDYRTFYLGEDAVERLFDDLEENGGAVSITESDSSDTVLGMVGFNPFTDKYEEVNHTLLGIFDGYGKVIDEIKENYNSYFHYTIDDSEYDEMISRFAAYNELHKQITELHFDDENELADFVKSFDVESYAKNIIDTDAFKKLKSSLFNAEDFEEALSNEQILNDFHGYIADENYKIEGNKIRAQMASLLPPKSELGPYVVSEIGLSYETSDDVYLQEMIDSGDPIYIFATDNNVPVKVTLTRENGIITLQRNELSTEDIVMANIHRDAKIISGYDDTFSLNEEPTANLEAQERVTFSGMLLEHSSTHNMYYDFRESLNRQLAIEFIKDFTKGLDKRDAARIVNDEAVDDYIKQFEENDIIKDSVNNIAQKLCNELQVDMERTERAMAILNIVNNAKTQLIGLIDNKVKERENQKNMEADRRAEVIGALYDAVALDLANKAYGNLNNPDMIAEAATDIRKSITKNPDFRDEIRSFVDGSAAADIAKITGKTAEDRAQAVNEFVQNSKNTLMENVNNKIQERENQKNMEADRRAEVIGALYDAVALDLATQMYGGLNNPEKITNATAELRETISKNPDFRNGIRNFVDGSAAADIAKITGKTAEDRAQAVKSFAENSKKAVRDSIDKAIEARQSKEKSSEGKSKSSEGKSKSGNVTTRQSVGNTLGK